MDIVFLKPLIMCNTCKGIKSKREEVVSVKIVKHFLMQKRPYALLNKYNSYFVKNWSQTLQIYQIIKFCGDLLKELNREVKC